MSGTTIRGRRYQGRRIQRLRRIETASITGELWLSGASALTGGFESPVGLGPWVPSTLATALASMSRGCEGRSSARSSRRVGRSFGWELVITSPHTRQECSSPRLFALQEEQMRLPIEES